MESRYAFQNERIVSQAPFFSEFLLLVLGSVIPIIGSLGYVYEPLFCQVVVVSYKLFPLGIYRGLSIWIFYLFAYVLGSKLPIFPYNRGWSSTQ